jgi:hypothetical protein
MGGQPDELDWHLTPAFMFQQGMYLGYWVIWVSASLQKVEIRHGNGVRGFDSPTLYGD